MGLNMATDIAGLFGVTPETYQMAQEQQARQQAAQFAGMDPFQRANYGLFLGGRQLGGAIGQALGAQDPMLQQISQQQALLKTVNLADPASLIQAAQQAASFNPQLAMSLADRATTLQQQQTALNLATSKAKREEMVATREEKLQNALSNLPPDATEDQVLAVMREFGKPEAVMSALEKNRQATLAAQAKKELQQEKIEAARLQQERDQEFKRSMAMLTQGMKAAVTDLQKEKIKEQIQALKDKRQDKEEKKLAALEGAVAGADRIIAKVDEALPLVSGMTAGLGSVTSYIPGTSGANLKSTLETIKANLGFDRLQQMRDASPTGGALGQVAVQELNALQASVSSLDLNQSPDVLRKNLEQIRFHYSKWRDASMGKLPEAMRPTGSTAMPPVPPTGGQGWSIKKVD